MDIDAADILPEGVWDKKKNRSDAKEAPKKKTGSAHSITPSTSLGHDTETPGGDRTPPFHDPDDV